MSDINLDDFNDIDSLAEEVEKELTGEDVAEPQQEKHESQITLSRMSYEAFRQSEVIQMANKAFAEFIFKWKFGQYEEFLTSVERDEYVRRIAGTEFFTATIYALYYYLAPHMPALDKAVNSPALIPLTKVLALGSTLGTIEDEIKRSGGLSGAFEVRAGDSDR